MDLNYFIEKVSGAMLSILVAVSSSGQDTLKADNSKPAPTVLFICEHGAARSTIAAAYFNRLVKEKGLNYQAIFRGTNPDLALAPATQKGLLKDGFDVATWKPLPVLKDDIENA